MYPGSSPLPDELTGTYHFVTQMPPTGGEATLYEVTEVPTGAPRILKLYHPHVKLKVEALGRIRALDSAHTVRLIDYDRLSDGRWYEVQERVAGGNLVDYRRRMGNGLTAGKLKDVVAELSAAIAAFHNAGLAHHDIKPENYSSGATPSKSGSRRIRTAGFSRQQDYTRPAATPPSPTRHPKYQ